MNLGRVLMVGIAFGGSLLYGASLALALHTSLLGTALWLTAGAGLGWAALIPALVVSTRRPLMHILDACLVSICFGEAVLFLGGIGNLVQPDISGAWSNLCVVLISNVVMAGVLALQLRRLGVQVASTLGTWFLVLDGVGGIAFWSLSFLLTWGMR